MAGETVSGAAVPAVTVGSGTVARLQAATAATATNATNAVANQRRLILDSPSASA